ncbi:hypothetical protein TEA_000417 [Camellia sinensis var. sinensis]|uniref:Late embryogenesis abundant protein LEA-2 subgroup domain-containing protein n=1 Tax=Camellia sinensis var. sinensis TaxID=542762 RepID=A0A4S4E747_CAMSN|nr:hypothetical protein TEA_000417 [Camellia sinensis var. sinensis]
MRLAEYNNKTSEKVHSFDGVLSLEEIGIVKPNRPSYQVQGLTVQAFDLQPNFSLLTEFFVTVKAENSNENVGFKYGRDNFVIVSYKDSTLCTGHFPSFLQGHKNTTMINVFLKGREKNPTINICVAIKSYSWNAEKKHRYGAIMKQEDFLNNTHKFMFDYAVFEKLITKLELRNCSPNTPPLG